MRHLPALALAALLAAVALRAGFSGSPPGPGRLALFSFAVSALRGRL